MRNIVMLSNPIWDTQISLHHQLNNEDAFLYIINNKLNINK